MLETIALFGLYKAIKKLVQDHDEEPLGPGQTYLCVNGRVTGVCAG